MKSKSKNIVLSLMFLGLTISAFAQNSITISGTKVVSGGDVFKVPAGSTLIFEPGAILSVEGGLELQGTEESPVSIVSKDPQNPGRGIQVNGWDQSGQIVISNVKFDGLTQPLRFDPFWYRKSVQLNKLTIKNSSSGEPVLYVANPTIDLSKVENKATFSIDGLNVINNTSGVLLESFNSEGLIYNLDNLRFSDNYITGSDESFGILTFNFENGSTLNSSRVGNVLLQRNFAGSTPLGIAVSGSSNQFATVEKLFINDGTRLIYDQSKDPRIPLVKTEIVTDLDLFGVNNYLTDVGHQFGTVKAFSKGSAQFVELRDSQDRLVEFNLVKVGITQMYHYIQGLPQWGYTNDGTKVRIPSVLASEISNIYVTKIDTGEYYDYLRKKNDEEKFYSTHLVLDKYLTLPVIKQKDEVLKSQKTWEVGLWGGGAIYGGGDIKHKTTKDFKSAPDVFKKMFLVKDIPVFSTIEYSRGLYAQYNINQRFSTKVNGYYTSISMHNIYAPGVLAGGKIPVSINKNYDPINVYKFTWPLNFYTRMFVLEGEGLWHLVKNEIKPGKKGVWVPSLGLSVGMMYYTPYRFTFTEQKKDENYFAFRRRLYRDHMYNLRKVGSEGQNFLPGGDAYNSMALNLGTSFSLAYRMKKWSFKGEIKAVYTSTDYLDDFGPGVWYGGDINKVRENVQIDEWYKPTDINQLTIANQAVAPNAPRSTNGLNDWYYQMHLGVSYDITGFSFNKKKKLESTITPEF